VAVPEVASIARVKPPDPERSWEYENSFWLSAPASRLSKVLAQYELFKLISDVPGAIVECGVFKGASFSRFAMLRHLLATSEARELVGFDTFGRFPDAGEADDQPVRAAFVDAAGEQSITAGDLESLLAGRDLGTNVRLVSGDIVETVPRFVEENPALRIALLNIDTDIYEPAVTALEHLYDRVVTGGVVILDDYGVFPGETRAAEAFLAGRDVAIKRFPWAPSPSYFVKPDPAGNSDGAAS
jgi:hypothetical protein